MTDSPCSPFTIDVEDYFQVSAFDGVFPRDRWPAQTLRLGDGVRQLLDLLDEAGTKGTFYVLGWLAERAPQLVAEIARRGHEIGCHSYLHHLVYDLTPDQFRVDLRMALSAIEDASGVRCRLYRAPSFSVTRTSLWALRIMAEEGIELDSSVYPVRHDRYGIPGAPRAPFRPLPDVPRFVEFPPTTFRLLGMTLPCAGGGYLRIYPMALTRYALRQVIERDGRPAVLYVHPWELDPEQPIVPIGRLGTFRHRANLRVTAGRLRELLRLFRFGTMTDAVTALGGSQALPLVDLGPAEA